MKVLREVDPIDLSAHLEESTNAKVSELLNHFKFPAELNSCAKEKIANEVTRKAKEIFQAFNHFPNLSLPSPTQADNQKDAITVRAITKAVLEKLVVEKSDIAIAINDEAPEENRLITYWHILTAHYDRLDANNPSSLISFLNAAMLFRQKFFEFFSPDRDLDYQAQLLHSFSALLSEKKLSIQFSEEKVQILKKLFMQACIGSEPQYRPLISELASAITNRLDENIQSSDAPSSSLMVTFVNRSITSIAKSLDNFITLGFNKDIIQSHFKLPAKFPKELSHYEELKNYLLQNEDLIAALNGLSPAIITQIQMQKNLVDKKVSLRHSLSTVEGESLKKLQVASKGVRENGTQPIKFRSREDQAAFKQKVIISKYTITAVEADLLREICGIRFLQLVPNKNPDKNYSAGTLSYDELKAHIDREILRRENENKKPLRKYIPFRKLSTSHLYQARIFVQYHSIKRFNALHPEKAFENERYRNALQSSKAIRSTFIQWVNKLSSLFGVNRKLKKLKASLIYKTQVTSELKQEATLLLGKTVVEKSLRNQQTLENLADEISFNAAGIPATKVRFISRPSALKAHGTFFKENNLSLKAAELMDMLKELELVQQYVVNELTHAQETYQSITGGSWSSNFTWEEYEKVNNQDSKILFQTILGRTEKLMGSSSQNTPDELKNYINEIGLIAKLSSDLNHLLLAEISSLPIDEYKFILKNLFMDSYQKILKAHEVPQDFKVHDESAYTNLALMIKNLKRTKDVFKEHALLYTASFAMHLKAKKDVLVILSNILCNTSHESKSDLLKTVISSLDKNLTLRHIEESSLKGTGHIEQSKMLLMIKDLNYFLEHIEEEDLGMCIEKYKKEIDSLKEKYELESRKVKRILESAKDSVDSFMYLAKHTTTSLGNF